MSAWSRTSQHRIKVYIHGHVSWHCVRGKRNWKVCLLLCSSCFKFQVHCRCGSPSFHPNSFLRGLSQAPEEPSEDSAIGCWWLLYLVVDTYFFTFLHCWWAIQLSRCWYVNLACCSRSLANMNCIVFDLLPLHLPMIRWLSQRPDMRFHSQHLPTHVLV